MPAHSNLQGIIRCSSVVFCNASRAARKAVVERGQEFLPRSPFERFELRREPEICRSSSSCFTINTIHDGMVATSEAR